MINTLINQRYQINAELGSGGMGVVYRAYDLLLEREVAIKALSRDAFDPDNRARLLHEARAVASLNHPHIVSVYDAGEMEGMPYIVMELVHGRSLRSMPDLSIEQIILIFIQICEALDYAHSQGVVHRDIKPENILVVQTGEHLTAKLNDFGLAVSSKSIRLSMKGTLIGTPFYMAPELIQGEKANRQSDVYALGAVLYEVIAGRPPFEADDLIAVLSQHINAAAVPCSTFNSEIPAAIDRLILQMLEKNPADRPPLKDVAAVLTTRDRYSFQPVIPQQLLPIDRISRGRLVGREQEIETADSIWQKAVSGESSVLLISGEPGIGKTRFICELMARARVQGAQVLLGECYAEGSAPYAPVAQMIGSGPIPPDLPGFVTACFISIAPRLSVKYPDFPPNAPLDPESELLRLSDSLLEWCRLLCQNSPLMMVLDDAHWADSGTLALFRNLARRAARMQLRFLLVLTYREVELDESRAFSEVLLALNREHLSNRIKLPRLSMVQTEGMLKVLFNEDISPELLNALYRETEGNPFFIEEVCKTLIEEGQVYRDGDGWNRLAIEQMQIPQSVRIAIQARVSRLGQPVQETLSLAAILGREFEFSILKAITNQDEDSLIDAIEQAEQAQLIQQKSPRSRDMVTPEPIFMFTHALIHATLFDAIGGLRRQRLHRQVSGILEKMQPDRHVLLAYHYSQAGLPDEARSSYLRAGDSALGNYANQEAEKYYRLAVDLAGPPEDQACALYGLGLALFHQSRFTEAIDQWQSAVPIFRSLHDFDHLAETYAFLVKAARSLDDIEGSLALAEEGLRLLKDVPVSVGLAALFRQAGTSYSFRRMSERAVPLWLRALQIAEETGSIEQQSRTLIRLGFDYAYDPSGKLLDEGLLMITRAYELAESAGFKEAAGSAQAYLSEIQRDFKGDMHAAIEHAEIAARISRQIGDASDELFALGLLSTVHIYLGNVVQLLDLMKRGQFLKELVEPTGPPLYLYYLMQAGISYYEGKMDSTIQVLQLGLDDARRNKNTGYEQLFANNLSALLMDMGRWTEAEATFRQAAQTDWSELNASELGNLAIIFANTDRLDEASMMLDNARNVVDNNPYSMNQIVIGQAEAEIAAAGRQWEKAWQILTGLTAILSQIGIRFFLSRLLRRWIDLRIMRGEDEDILEARGLQKQLLSVYRDMGAVTLAEQTESIIIG